jgi:ABC-type transporter Mla maintaining outer membrane lipid asymmetry ATPase subunit MlaF
MSTPDILYQTLSLWNEEFLPLHETVYASVLSSVQKERAETVPQAHVIVGAEGNGKTVLLKRLMSALSACEGSVLALWKGKQYLK